MEGSPAIQPNNPPPTPGRLSLSPRMLRPQTRARLERALPLLATPEQQRAATNLESTPLKNGWGQRSARMTGRGVLTLGALVPGLLLAGGAGIFAGTFRALEATGASPHIKKTTPFDVGYFLKQYDRLTTKKKAA